MAENIDVAFTIDNNYPLYSLLVINSIIISNQSNSDYTFWIVENNVSLLNKLKMYIFVKSRKQKIKFVHISTKDLDKGKNLYGTTVWSKHVSRIGTARIYIPNLVPKDIHKILYLDSDVLVTSDLKELFDTDINDYAAAMAKDVEDYRKNPYNEKPIYYNSGVILMNLDYWRKNNLTEKAVTYILENEKLQYPDQDAINFAINGKVKIIEPKWNNQEGHLVDYKNGGIIHYIGPYKPWDFEWLYSYMHGAYTLYYEYWDKSYLIIYKHPYLTKSTRLYIRNSKIFIANIIKQISCLNSSNSL